MVWQLHIAHSGNPVGIELGESRRYRSYFTFFGRLKHVSRLWIHPTGVLQYSLSMPVKPSTRIKGISLKLFGI